MNYNRSLDGLRGIAILLVLLFHYNFLVGLGWVGVQLFFVLSGYLITTILLSEKENPLAFYLKRFYWRRTLRIFPLYYAYLFLIAALFILKGLPEEFPKLFPFLATYTFNFYPLIKTYSYEDYFFMHFWSLSVEEQFYLVWPLVIFFCNRKQLQIILLAIIAGAPIVRFALTEILLTQGLSSHYVGETVYRFTLGQWDGFAFGALIPIFSLADKKFPIRKAFFFSLGTILLLGAFNSYTLIQNSRTVPFSSLGYQIAELINYQQVWSYTLFDLFFFAMILYIISPTTHKWLVKIMLENRIMVYMGKISYGLYVYHWIIWMAFNKYLKALFPFEVLGFLIYTSLCFVVASLSYYILEQPILSLKDKFFVSLKPTLHEKN